VTTLHYNILQPDALVLFRILGTVSELDTMTLVGGTALALQIGHRFSLDFDFATFENILPTRKIDVMMSNLKDAGHTLQLITNSTNLSQFKINTGENLLDYARDYVINGVKVTFFVLGRTLTQREHYKQSKKIKIDGNSFDVLGLEAIKTAKTLVLADRVRSRDLFDLMILMQNFKLTIEQQMRTIQTLGHIDDTEYYKAVMTGRIPIDKEDEGLQAVNVNITLEKMYIFFDDKIAEYEICLAKNYFSDMDY